MHRICCFCTNLSQNSEFCAFRSPYSGSAYFTVDEFSMSHGYNKSYFGVEYMLGFGITIFLRALTGGKGDFFQGHPVFILWENGIKWEKNFHQQFWCR